MVEDRDAIAAVMTAGAHRLPRTGEQPDPMVRMLVSEAAKAVEMFGDDLLESWAAQHRARGTDPGEAQK